MKFIRIFEDKRTTYINLANVKEFYFIEQLNQYHLYLFSGECFKLEFPCEVLTDNFGDFLQNQEYMFNEYLQRTFELNSWDGIRKEKLPNFKNNKKEKYD